MFKRILFVCVGNICRSPMAEGLLKHRLANKRDLIISSAGLAAVLDKPAALPVQTLLKDRDIDISTHRAKQLDQQMIVAADLILTMESIHKKQIERQFPYAHGKVFLIGKWRNFEVLDPYGGTFADFEYAMQRIDAGLDDWQKRLC